MSRTGILGIPQAWAGNLLTAAVNPPATIVQHVEGGADTAAEPIVIARPQIGDQLIAWANSDALVTLADDGTNTWTLCATVVANNAAYMWCRTVTATDVASLTTVTFTPTGGAAVIHCGVIEVAGLAALPAVDPSATSADPSTGTSTVPLATPAAASGSAGSFVLAIAALESFSGIVPTAPVWSAGFTNLALSTGTASNGGTTICATFVGFSNQGTPGPTSPVCSWTSSDFNRELLVQSFAVAGTVPIPFADFGAGTEQAPLVGRGYADTGTGADSQTVAPVTTINVSDVGTGADSAIRVGAPAASTLVDDFNADTRNAALWNAAGGTMQGFGPTEPAIPPGVAAVPGNAQATISWTAPDSGGSPILTYTVTASPGGATATVSALSAVMTGLVNGTTYTFTVRALNAIGTGVDSPPTAPVTPGAGPLDTFARTVPAGGWGTADVGGPWTPGPGATAANFSVNGAVGLIALPAVTPQPVGLQTLSFTTVAINFDFSLSALPSAGNFVFLYAWFRVNPAGSAYYRAGVYIDSAGTMCLRAEGVPAVTLFPDATPDAFSAYVPGTWMTVKAQLSTASPTNVAVKAWPQGTTEPAYQVTGSDPTNIGPQTGGYIGLRATSSGDALTVSFDNYQAVSI